MPYRKKRYSKKRPGYGACGKMVWGDAKKALKIAVGVKRLLNVEIKNHDVQLLNLAVTDTPAITQLTNIPQGGTTITRDGAQCKVLGIELNYLILFTAASTHTIVRVMVVLDKQTNQAIYTASDLLEDASIIDNLSSPRNLNNKHRFTVLYDVRHRMDPSNASITVKKFIKKECLLRFDGSTPSIADLTQNSLSILKVSNEVTNDPLFSMFCRIRYVDN